MSSCFKSRARILSWKGALLLLGIGSWGFVLPAIAQTPPPTPVDATPATTRDLPVTLDAVGTVSASKEAPIRSVKSDRIVSILVKDGQSVSEGDVLFKLDDTVEQAQISSAQSALSVAQKALDRTQQLTKSGAAARSKLPEAQADVEKAQAALDSAQVDLNHTLVKAPFDGILGLLLVEEGDYASPTTELVTIYAMPPMTALFEIPQRKLSLLAPGQAVSVWTSAYPDERTEGEITVIDPAVNRETRAVKVKATLPQGGKLRPGMFAAVSVTVETLGNAVLVPESALVPTSQGILVYTVVDGKAKAVPVVPGLRVDGLVQIPEGVAAGEMVITAGQARVAPGAPVAVQNAKGGDKQQGGNG